MENVTISTRQAADELGVSVQRVRRLIRDGVLFARRERDGGRWHVLSGSVRRYARDRRNGRPRQTRTCPACGGLAQTTTDRAMRHGRYVWRCTVCGMEYVNIGGCTETLK